MASDECLCPENDSVHSERIPACLLPILLLCLILPLLLCASGVFCSLLTFLCFPLMLSHPNIQKGSYFYKLHDVKMCFTLLFLLHTQLLDQATSGYNIPIFTCIFMFLHLHFSPFCW